MNLSTALRTTESVKPVEQQIFDAEFDDSMLLTAWRVLLLPGIRQIILWLLEISGMGTPGMLKNLDGWMNARGLELIDQAGAVEYRRRYLEPIGREMKIYPGERIALGEVA